MSKIQLLENRLRLIILFFV